MLFRKMRLLGAIGFTGMVAAAGCGSSGPASTNGDGVGAHPAAVPGHPRLWLNDESQPDLKTRAIASNPFYAQGLEKVALDYKMLMDSGQIPANADDCADSSGIGGIICEWPMEVFGLMSLVSSDVDARDDYARRARSLLMNIIEKAKLGPLAGDPIRDPTFPISNRGHYGEAFGLTVDWVYPYLTASDKADIREVFLAWCDANVNAETTTDNHPTPIGVFNDPVLLKDKVAVRFAGNNYFTSHARNMGLMAMALDPADDPDGKLHAYLDNATGAFLYMTDALLRGDAKGGLLPEGYEYDFDTGLNIGQLLLALHTAGLDDPAKRGQQVQMSSNPFYAAQADAYLHGLAPQPQPDSCVGEYYGFPAFGDIETIEPYGAPQEDPISTLAPVALIAKDAGDTATYDKIRWIQNNMPPGLLPNVIERANSDYAELGPIFYFLLMDPKAAGTGTDPRPSMPTDYWSEGLNFLFARTGWGPGESYFAYQLEWTGMDHRHADDNHYSFFRKGEWITCERSGYAGVFFTGPMHNNVAVENDPPSDTTDQLTQSFYQTGSGYVYEGAGDGTVLAHSVGTGYAYALGDAAALHNSVSMGSTAVTQLSRSILWLKPDHVITYDRVATKSAGGFKRVYVQLPTAPTVSGSSAAAKTAGGQGIFYTSLLPIDAVLTNDAVPSDTTALGAPMMARLLIDAPSNPASTTFLGVLQGADAGASADPVTAFTNPTGTPFQGVLVKGAAVLFPVDPSAAFTGVEFQVPSATTHFYVTGLAANGKYDVTQTPADAKITVSVQPGAAKTADAGGVLAF
jgi:hypothetical protein